MTTVYTPLVTTEKTTATPALRFEGNRPEDWNNTIFFTPLDHDVYINALGERIDPRRGGAIEYYVNPRDEFLARYLDIAI